MSSALMEMIGGGGGAPAPGGDLPPAMPDPEPHLAAPTDAPAEGPPEAAVDAPADDPQTAEVESLKSLLGITRSYLELPTVEPDEALKMKKIEMLVHELLAGNQKMQDSLSGANPALRKALGPSGG